MSKTKVPLLSLEAHGTISDTVTYQGRGNRKVARSKPTPPYFLTLPARYQRWLYQDYAYLWNSQAPAIKQIYATAGTAYHLTGFQYWMKYHLTRLPDIEGYWKLDDNTGPTTQDSSRQDNPGTIIGPSPATGLIDRCLNFDGLNDHVNCGPAGSISEALTLEAFCYPIDDVDTFRTVISRYSTVGANRSYVLVNNWDAQWTLYVSENGVAATAVSIPLALSQWQHVAAVFDPPNITIYRDGTPSAPVDTGYSALKVTATPLYIGEYNIGTGRVFNGSIDQVVIYNRALSNAEITRHAARRWPPQ